MKISKLFFAIFCSVLLLMSCSTNIKSDKETENKLAGQWETVDKQDGVNIIERVTYNPDHTWESSVSVIVDTISTPLCSFVANGTWRASEKQLIEETDVKSIKYTYEPSMEIVCELPALINAYIKDSKEPWIVEIVSFGENQDGRPTVTFLDGDDSVTYVKTSAP